MKTMGSSPGYRLRLTDSAPPLRAHFLLIPACEHAVTRTGGSLHDPARGNLMFQLFTTLSGADNRDQAALRMNDDAPHEEDALAGERPATYDEMLP
jgi:hypothetical protein